MESDAEFLDRIESVDPFNPNWRPGDSVRLDMPDFARLFALARRGAAMQAAADDQFTRIQQLETALQDLAEIALKLEKERDSLKAASQTVGHLDNAETAALRAAMALKIDEKQFLAAVDREGDYECGAGKFTDDKRAHSAFANSENASDPECTCCGGTGITYQTERRCACQPLPPPPKGAEE